MTGWALKRFWAEAKPSPVEGGFAILLDGRAVKTPAKAPLVVPSRALAREIAAEWDAQTAEVRPETMPFTRMANSAIDKVAPQQPAVAAMLAEYGGSDLICYRADGPAPLVARQAAAWDDLVAWARDALGADLVVTHGVMHRAQPAASLHNLAARVAALTPFQLAGFHDLVALSGSLVIALAVICGRLSADAAWQASRVDETWQAEQWGVDDEAAELTAAKHQDFRCAARFYELCGLQS